MAEYYRVFVAPGRFFEDAGRIRIGFGGPPEIFKKNILKLAEVITNLAECRLGLKKTGFFDNITKSGFLGFRQLVTNKLNSMLIPQNIFLCVQ
ncbi:hypothetical protein HY768_07865 [candidate division TA06 bacterium]|uniref:Uncharacterized protein n=1 Tax=candidate division TA06 bacterium TaxID=2250710 RepID=A0A933IBW1_UNCT6|nr:hypothetical protein [candidate division TA06 bacterium]